MFGRSKKREIASTRIRDKACMSGEAKLHAFLNEWKNNPTVVFIFWFDDSLRQAESFFAKHTISPVTLLAREKNALQLTGKKIIIAEHHPLQQKENDLFQKLKLEEAEVWS